MFDFLKEAGEKLTREQKDTELRSNQAETAALTHQFQILSLKIEDLQVVYGVE